MLVEFSKLDLLLILKWNMPTKLNSTVLWDFFQCLKQLLISFTQKIKKLIRNHNNKITKTLFMNVEYKTMAAFKCSMTCILQLLCLASVLWFSKINIQYGLKCWKQFSSNNFSNPRDLWFKMWKTLF